ncbi:MAG: endonuclease/exonuclease/phosphatase family protein [Actinomycetes bacterium]
MTAEMRVLSWNMHGLRDDRRALVRVVREADPDVACVQEAPKYLRWRAKCAALARHCGLLYVTGGGTTGGSALLASMRVDVKQADEVCLSRQWGWPARGVAAAAVTKGGATLVVASIHLPLDARQRLDHALRVLGVTGSLGGPHVLAAGDINERPGHAAWQALHDGGLRDLGPHSGPTFPAVTPNKRIDGVLATEQVEVVDYEVLDKPGVARASDHRPVLVTVRVPTG